LCITLAIDTILWNNNNNEEYKKNNNEHNERIFGEIQNSITDEQKLKHNSLRPTNGLIIAA